MISRFRNRTEAGEQLADRLAPYARRSDVVVLALPRGGVPVANEVARRLSAPLDVFIVRKLGVPGHEELAMGAIASGGLRVPNDDVIQTLGLTEADLEAVTAREQRELVRREKAYRDGRPPLAVRGKTVILVDDGIATGSTMRAAIRALRTQQPKAIVVATPTIALSTYHEMGTEADEVVAVLTPEDFFGVGQWYDDFTQTTDDEVRAILQSRHHVPTRTES
ncbi:MAG: phosphoribosyltransferase [Verrucomicrobia bacterium]|nr:phosphoribosyltransferase [Verrucomicrobiota bacterium]